MYFQFQKIHPIKNSFDKHSGSKRPDNRDKVHWTWKAVLPVPDARCFARGGRTAILARRACGILRDFRGGWGPVNGGLQFVGRSSRLRLNMRRCRLRIGDLTCSCSFRIATRYECLFLGVNSPPKKNRRCITGFCIMLYYYEQWVFLWPSFQIAYHGVCEELNLFRTLSCDTGGCEPG